MTSVWLTTVERHHVNTATWLQCTSADVDMLSKQAAYVYVRRRITFFWMIHLDITKIRNAYRSKRANLHDGCRSLSVFFPAIQKIHVISMYECQLSDGRCWYVVTRWFLLCLVQYATISTFVKRHVVVKGDTLASIAVRCHSNINVLKRMNNMTSDHALHSRSHLWIPGRLSALYIIWIVFLELMFVKHIKVY